MNLFKKLHTEDVSLKIESLESLINDLQASHDTIVESNKVLTEQVAELVEQLKIKEEVIDTTEKKVEELEEVIEQKEEEIAEVLEVVVSVEEKASVKAMEILASSGVPVMETAEGEVLNIMDQMNTLKGKELVEFYNKNKQEVFKELKK